jgi:ribonuclease T2
MFLWLLLLWFSQLVCIISMNSSTIYVFAYSWTPGFCIGQTYPGCASPLEYWKNNFTIHGLWPQYDTTGYPSSCTNEPFNSSIPIEVGLDTMVMRWPDVKYDVNNPNYDSFWEHEWTKHGTCSGLSQYEYFAAAIALSSVLMTPDLINESIGSSVNADLLRTSIAPAASVSLQCNHQQLVGIYTCWQQTDNLPAYLVTCPADVLQEDTCKATDEVYIPEL